MMLRLTKPREWPVATLLPAGTILFDDVPDIHRSKERWPATALAQIVHEPEVQAFLTRPKTEVPGGDEVGKRKAQLQAIDPTHCFLAVTEWNGSGAPKVIAGLEYAGDKKNVEALADELRKEVQVKFPAGKSDIEKYGSGDIETFTAPGYSAGIAYRGQWVFIATDLDPLKALLDRYDGKPSQDTLADTPAFKKSMEQMPADPDNFFFAQPALIADKLASLMMMLNPVADTNGLDAMKKIEAFAMGTRMDGELMRDAIFTAMPPTGSTAPLAMDALKLSSSGTMLVSSGRTDNWNGAKLPDPKADQTGLLMAAESYLKAFTDQGLGVDQLKKAFGPEVGFVLDWPNGVMTPTPLLMVDVQDAVEADKFLNTLTTLPGANFTRHDSKVNTLYSMPQTGIGLFPLQVTLGETAKVVVGALSPDAVNEATRRWDSGTPGLADTDTFKKAAALVQPPTISFGYLDTKAVFERLYGLFRGAASMGLVPHLGDFVDIARLPAPETISRHLSPVVSSGAVKKEGILIQSAGPVTNMQAALGLGAIVGAAAVPIIQAEMKNGGFPSIPGFGSGPGASGGVTTPVTPFTPSPSKPTATPASGGHSEATPPPAQAASPSAGTP